MRIPFSDIGGKNCFMQNVKLTVYLSTYNQEEYVAQALDSILMQKTDFPFEVIVADDCSTDKTQSIILEYQKDFPLKIRTYFTLENVGGCQKLVNCIDGGYFNGEYIALLEGDDYWLDENRLQVLVDFLDQNPKYSRVSHKRLVIDENNQEKGFDIPNDVLNKPFYIEDFLEGKQYSDFGSVFRNYYIEAGSKYNRLLLASRNVCDFQDMFITQDFGPVYVMDQCFGVYRSRSIPGATNYNSIMSQKKRCIENIHLAHAVEQFYAGKYDLTLMIRNNQRRLLAEAVNTCDSDYFNDCRKYMSSEIMDELLAEQIYLAWRGKRKEQISFIKTHVDKGEITKLVNDFVMYFLARVRNKLMGKETNNKARGVIKN